MKLREHCGRLGRTRARLEITRRAYASTLAGWMLTLASWLVTQVAQALRDLGKTGRGVWAIIEGGVQGDNGARNVGLARGDREKSVEIVIRSVIGGWRKWGKSGEG